jgi:predicted nuclease with RNAse H fold
VLTAGVDLAAEPRGTALAVIDWSGDSARVVELELGVGDDRIADVAPTVASLGIDCAFGWPDDFVSFITRHSAGEPLQRLAAEGGGSGIEWRRRLAYRETDRAARERTGRWPLSVATDRLGLTAMHCAALLDALAGVLGPIDRAAGGVVAEVYPSATLRLWGFSTLGYKTDAAVRRVLLDAIVDRAPWLDLAPVAGVMTASDDVFDAVIAALAARAHALGLWHRPPTRSLERAGREGWIVLPSVDLAELAPVPGRALA